MDIASLRWFQQVADGATVTEVSELDQVSQSGVSRALARLEREVGVPLLHRSGRVLRMTRAGATFKRHVDKVLHDLDDGLAALSELTSPDTGTVVVAYQPSFGTWLVPDLVAAFRAEHPGVQFVLRQIRTDTGAVVARGDVDLEITTRRPSEDTVRWRPLLSQPLRLAVVAGHALAEDGPIELAHVRDEPFVLLPRSYVLRETSENLCARAGFTPRVAFEGEDLSAVTGLVGAGLGVSIVPVPLSRPSHAAVAGSIVYRPIADATASRQIGLVWSRERRLLPAAAAFRAFAVAWAAGTHAAPR
ncbi:LysR family transcriptional regulator [Jatrophihabitans fulvus]